MIYCKLWLNVLIGLLLYTRIYGQLALNMPAVGNYGEETHMNCTEASFDIAYGYTWYKDNMIIYDTINGDATGKYTSTHGSGFFTLNITNTVVDDTGEYVCNHNFVEESGTLEIQSQGTTTAKLSSSNQMEFTFKQIYPNTTSANITCDSKILTGSFVSLVADGDRFTCIWQSLETFSTVPSSCSASVELISVIIIEEIAITALIPKIIAAIAVFVVALIVVSTVIGFFVIQFVPGVVYGNKCFPKNWVRKSVEDWDRTSVEGTCCNCYGNYECESCTNCVSKYCAGFKFCYMDELPSWYQILWYTVIGIPFVLGFLLTWKFSKKGKRDKEDTSTDVEITSSSPKNGNSKLLNKDKQNSATRKAEGLNKGKHVSDTQIHPDDKVHSENEGKSFRPQPPLPTGANINHSQLPNIHGHDKKGRGLSANFGDDGHPLVAIDTPAQKAGTLPTLEDTPRETKKKTKKKKKDKQEDNQNTETVLDF